MKALDLPKKEEKAGELTADFECACNTCPSQEACKAAQETTQIVPVEEKIDFSNVVIEPLFEDQVDFETFSRAISAQSRFWNAKQCPSPKSF